MNIIGIYRFCQEKRGGNHPIFKTTFICPLFCWGSRVSIQNYKGKLNLIKLDKYCLPSENMR